MWAFIYLTIFILVRISFIRQAEPLSGDESALVHCLSKSREFVHQLDWSQRWTALERHAQGRVLWVLSHLAWDNLTHLGPAAPGMLNTICSLVAGAALIAAARNLYGRRAAYWTCLLVFLSPLFLVFSVRMIATMPAIMWIGIALACLSRPACGWFRAAVAGLCLGLAFVTHYGTGVVILAVAAGMAWQTLLHARKKNAGERMVRIAVGAAAAVIPPLACELWARRSNGVYFQRLIAHENIGSVMSGDAAGPHGLFLRALIELDPLICVLIVFVLLSSIFDRQSNAISRLAWAMTLALLGTATFSGLAGASAHARGMTAAVAVAGCAMWMVSRAALRRPLDERGMPASSEALFSRTSLGTAAIVAMALFFFARPLGCMPRLMFTAWPLIVLLAAGGASRFDWRMPTLLFRGMAVAAFLGFMVGAAWIDRAKTTRTRTEAFRAAHPDWQGLAYTDLLAERPYAYERLTHRDGAALKIIGAPERFYPAHYLEEEPYKTAFVGRRIASAGLGDALDINTCVGSYVLFREAKSALFQPPEGVNQSLRIVGIESGDGDIRRHAYRGLEWHVRGGPGEQRLTGRLHVPGSSSATTLLAIEAFAVADIPLSDGVEISLAVLDGERELTSIPLTLPAFELFEHAALRFPRPLPEQLDFRVAVRNRKGDAPPTSCYIRRVFKRSLDRPFSEPAPVVAIEAPERIDDYPRSTSDSDSLLRAHPETDRTSRGLGLTRPNHDKGAGGLRWTATAWDGHRVGEIVFPGSFETGVRCSLHIDDQALLEFELAGVVDQIWNGPRGSRLIYRHLGYDMGNHGLFFLTLPAELADASRAISLEIKAIGGTQPWLWFGIRAPMDRIFVRGMAGTASEPLGVDK